MRFDLYSLIHKAQRKHLFDLSVNIGRANLKDPAQLSPLKEELEIMVERLRKHAEVEDTYIHPLFHKIGNQGEMIEKEHHDLERLLDNLEKSLSLENQESLYTRFNQFLIAYLSHIDAEETAQKDILWKHYDDKTLQEVIQRFTASLTPEQSLDSFKFIFPCISLQERDSILNSLKENAPKHVYEAVCLIAKMAL
jgi:uncharacterized membrane-anchored protein YjiN (DUF445 family)